MPFDVRRLKRGIESTLPFVRLIADRTNSDGDNELVKFLELVQTLSAADLEPLQFEPPDDP